MQLCKEGEETIFFPAADHSLHASLDRRGAVHLNQFTQLSFFLKIEDRERLAACFGAPSPRPVGSIKEWGRWPSGTRDDKAHIKTALTPYHLLHIAPQILYSDSANMTQSKNKATTRIQKHRQKHFAVGKRVFIVVEMVLHRSLFISSCQRWS